MRVIILKLIDVFSQLKPNKPRVQSSEKVTQQFHYL